MHECGNEIVIEDGTEMMGNKIKSKAKGSMDEHSAPAGDMATMTGLYFKKHHINISQ